MLAFLNPCSITIATSRKLARISSSSCSASSSAYIPLLLKPKRRKNYLRPKLLKTLAKPHPTPVPLPHPDESIAKQSERLETTSDEISGEAIIMIEPERNSVIVEDAVIPNAVCDSSVFSKFVLWVVGICVFQAACAIWVLSSSAGYDQKGESFEDENVKRESNHSFNGQAKVLQNVLSVEESDLEERVCKIRAMAEEVRRKERNVLKIDDSESILDDFEDSEISDGGKSFRDLSGIEKEVDERLLKLKNKLKDAGSKSLLSYLKMFEKNGDRKRPIGVAHVKESSKTKLVYSKKFQFRSPSIDSRTKPKGFQKMKDGDLSITKNSSSGKPLDEGSNGIPQKEVTENMQMHGKKLGDGIEASNMARETRSKPLIGSVKETSFGKKSLKGKRLRKSKQRANNFKSQRIKNKPEEKEILDTQSGILTASWWLNLSHVLTIYIRSVSDTTEGRPGDGFFRLQLASSDLQDHEEPYGVAFEDHSDANNFCFILEASFEDLGDFGIDIIPLSKEELKEALESHNMKMIVVKKRQIKFYAGQPLAEVEMALHAIIELKQVVK